MKNKLTTLDSLKDLVKDGMTIMVSGFMGCGSPHEIIDKLVELEVKDLTLICNDSGLPEYGVGKMVVAKQFSSIKASHIGLNRETGRQLNAGETDVELIPQGTLIERIRSAGAGLGGVLTSTGIGTVVEEGKQIVEVEGEEFILEKPLHADVAIIGGSIVDKKGNTYYNGATRNFGSVMATAADVVIIEAEKLVEIGEIAPENVMTPHIFVDYIIERGA